jgi:hypothetical protein
MLTTTSHATDRHNHTGARTHRIAARRHHDSAVAATYNVDDILVSTPDGATQLATGTTGTVATQGVVPDTLTCVLALGAGAPAIVANQQYQVRFRDDPQSQTYSTYLSTCEVVPANPATQPYQFHLDQGPGRAASTGGAPGTTQYEVQIDMSAATANDLAAGNYYLYGFKAVQSSMGGGAPLVWFATKAYSVTTAVKWQTQYQAYTSSAEDIPDGQVTATFAMNIDLGQVLEVTNGTTGTGTVQGGGPSPTAIGIQNQTTTQFTAGISQVVGNPAVASPLCAFPLYGMQLDLIAPIEKILLMFSSQPLNTGAVIEQAYSPGILIDLTADNFREVSYDINTGWTWGGGAWAQQVPPNANLAPLLIETPQAARTQGFRRHTLVS